MAAQNRVNLGSVDAAPVRLAPWIIRRNNNYQELIA